MKTRSVSIPMLIRGAAVIYITFFLSCSSAKKQENTELFTHDMLPAKDIKFLTSKGFIAQDETIVYLYYPIKISKGGILLTDTRVIVYDKEKEEQELLENIFDLSSNHAVSAENKSKITLYRKDDSEFSYEFPGGIDIDETFFSELRSIWRNVLAKNQAGTTADTTSGGVFMGVKPKEEKESELKLK